MSFICKKKGIKREGESCNLNNNCIYPNCKQMELHELKEACQNPDITDEQIYDMFQSFNPSNEDEFDKALVTVMKYRAKALDVTISKK